MLPRRCVVPVASGAPSGQRIAVSDDRAGRANLAGLRPGTRPSERPQQRKRPPDVRSFNRSPSRGVVERPVGDACVEHGVEDGRLERRPEQPLHARVAGPPLLAAEPGEGARRVVALLAEALGAEGVGHALRSTPAPAPQRRRPARSRGTSRTVIVKRFPARCPGFILCPCGVASWTTMPSSERRGRARRELVRVDPAGRLERDGLRGDRPLVLHPREARLARLAAEGARDRAHRVERRQVGLREANVDVRPLAGGGVRRELLDDEVLRGVLDAAGRTGALHGGGGE